MRSSIAIAATRFSRSARVARPVGAVLLGMFILGSGCGSPNAASIEVRKQNQDLRDQIATLTRTHEADQATIKGLQDRTGTVSTLPTDRLDHLFTTHGIELNRLTGGADLDRVKPGDEALKVYVVPTDNEGEKLK